MRVLLLDLDTLRPDHLGCYGYERNTSPNIDQVAREGVRFTNYYAANAPCLPSRSSLMSGRFGFHTGVVSHGGTAAEPFPQGPDRGFISGPALTSLPNIFKKKGCRTAVISPFAERHSAYWFYSGFDEMYNTGKFGREIAEDVSPAALDWIERNAKEDNWYLHINFWDAHTAYRTPEEFGNPFAGEPYPDWVTKEILKEHQHLVGPRKPFDTGGIGPRTSHVPRQPDIIENLDDVRAYVDGYDCGIRYMDEHLGKLFEALKAAGVWDDLCIIITSDHGENLGELGIYSEHATADEPTCKIPMIVRWNGGQKDVVDDALHYNLDLCPTLADLLETPKWEVWDGQSYARTLTEGKREGHDYLVLGQCAHVCQRSIRFDDYIYIRTYHDGYHLFDKHMLFNIKTDPYEQHNLAKEHPELVQKAASLMLDWLDEMMATQGNRPDPMWTVINEGGPLHGSGQLMEYIPYLEQTDRAYAVPELQKRHPGEFQKLNDRFPKG